MHDGQQTQPLQGVRVDGFQNGSPSEHDAILTIEALAFITDLARTFAPRVHALLRERKQRQEQIDGGARPTFLPQTKDIRESTWRVDSLPPDLLDRRVEITGPVERKMVINALNSGAKTYMADFEDATAPTWGNLIDGHVNLRDAVRRTISFNDATRGKQYTLQSQTATLMVRPRGWHLWEKHLLIDDQPTPAALFDFGMYFFHNAAELKKRGSGPYFYLPKLQSHREAHLWNDVFVHAQKALGLPLGTIKATVLIETIFAAFEMDEILHALRAHAAGLNCGRWDYIFSCIKTFCHDEAFVLPDRSQVGMQQPFMHAYTTLVVQTCHKRGAHAIGGMAAQIPIKEDPEANAVALEQVRQDKLREVQNGHDGTWVAHPALVPIAREVFDAHMKGANQIHRLRSDVHVSEADLLERPTGTQTEAGLRHNISVGVQYLAAWLSGNGCVPLYHLMEDAATAEISRAQVWQWIHHGTSLDDGQIVTVALFERILAEEMAAIEASVGQVRYSSGHHERARQLFAELSTAEDFAEFLTLPAYDLLIGGSLDTAGT